MLLTIQHIQFSYVQKINSSLSTDLLALNTNYFRKPLDFFLDKRLHNFQLLTYSKVDKINQDTKVVWSKDWLLL